MEGQQVISAPFRGSRAPRPWSIDITKAQPPCGRERAPLSRWSKTTAKVLKGKDWKVKAVNTWCSRPLPAPPPPEHALPFVPATVGTRNSASPLHPRREDSAGVHTQAEPSTLRQTQSPQGRAEHSFNQELTAR